MNIMTAESIRTKGEQSAPPFVESKSKAFTSLAAAAAWLYLLEEVVALVINEDKCREVLNLDFPDSLHAELGVLDALDALDVVLREDSGRTTD
jgi:hypothetical protein